MRLLFVVGILGISTVALAETKITTVQYIEQWNTTALEQMHAHHIPASITLAQGILESGSGNSRLAKEANNHFGIKCHKAWTGDTFIQDDDKKDECFRSYISAKESYNDHSLFLKKKRYAGLFELRLKDYKGWAKGLKSAGYATNPKYAHLLINLIERYHLYQYDRMTSADVASIKKAKRNNKIVPYTKQKNTSERHQPVAKKTPPPKEVKKPNYSGDVSVLKIGEKGHEVEMNENRVRYIVVKEGDTFYRIAKEFEMAIGQLYKYNEFKNKDVLEIGDRIYISPKRTKGPRGRSNYTCREDMTLRDIAHEQGIKLNSLMKLNLSENADEVLAKGSKVTLR